MCFYKLVSSKLLDRRLGFRRSLSLANGQYLYTEILVPTTNDNWTRTLQWVTPLNHRQLDLASQGHNATALVSYAHVFIRDA